MNIDLPHSFYLRKGEYYVYVENGTLIIYGKWNFDFIMKKISMEMWDTTKCYYCGKRLDKKRITVEHMRPAGYGGPTITNNIVLACQECNQQKGAMNPREFEKWKKLSGDERKQYYKEVIREKTKRYENPLVFGYDIPKSWYTVKCMGDILGVDSLLRHTGNKKFQKAMDYAKRTRKIPRPVLISRDNFLIGAKVEYYVARRMGMYNVPVIKLNNVVTL